VVPLCLLASQHPEVVAQLEHQVAAAPRDDEAGQFVIQNRRPARRLTEEEEELWALLENGPRPLHLLVDSLRHGPLSRRRIEQMEAARLVLRAGFTPTDALHCLGRLERWNGAASRLGAELLARQANLTADEFCQRVVTGVSDRVITELVSKVLSDEDVAADWDNEPAAAALLQRALEAVPGSDLVCRLGLARPVVAVGAPVEAYFPRVARQLHTELVIPPHADVANAVGAVVGAVVQELRVLIQPQDDGISFRLHLPGGVHDFPSLAECVEFAHRTAPGHLKALARRAGAGQVEIKVVRHDRRARVKGGWGEEIYLGTDLIFTAVGRPSLEDNRSGTGDPTAA
jgi:N-methylhydantoinase A/oxoprolinase/acetone carboxylase beta subunit